MNVLATELRSELERSIRTAREVAEVGARAALEALAVHLRDPHEYMSPELRALRNRLRAHGRQLGDKRDPVTGTQSIDRLVHECAYEHWHRMLFSRFLAENGLLIQPDHGVPISMEECEELAREKGVNPWALAGSLAQRMLPQIFRPDDPVLEVKLPPETQQQLERLLGGLPPVVFTADDALGWTYQFWQSAEKDRVNRSVASGEKVTGHMLPAVTQLFTEHYMVLFLLHNTIGAWHAGKVLAHHSSLARSASTEDELRSVVALEGYSFEYLRFIRQAGGEEDNTSRGMWMPAAGTFEAWPRRAKDLKVIDPACGSGHFLVAALPLLVQLRMAEENLSLNDAIQAVLAENLFGLELDLRCTQIAVFNLALTAWKMAGDVIRLPELNVACSGLSVGVNKTEWTKVAGRDIRLRSGMERLYDIFELAPELGSLVNPYRIVSRHDLSDTLHQLQPLLRKVFGRKHPTESDDHYELGVAIQGMAKAAELLIRQYHLVITNVPYLSWSKQNDCLKRFFSRYYPTAKNDLATVFLERCTEFSTKGGTVAAVTPQNWLFLSRYKSFREKLLNNNTWRIVARLGAGAFETVSGEVVKAILFCMSEGRHLGPSNMLSVIDASGAKKPNKKAEILRNTIMDRVKQADQLSNPGAAIELAEGLPSERISSFAFVRGGITTGDSPQYRRCFWENKVIDGGWVLQQSTVKSGLKRGTEYAGREYALLWENGSGRLAEAALQSGATIAGREAWTRKGIAIGYTSGLKCTLYTGEVFENTICVMIPKSDAYLTALWCFCSSDEFGHAVRLVNQKLSVDVRYFEKVPVDMNRWQTVAAREYPNGLPKPYSSDPTQWVFHGHPADSTHPLQVGVARLLGYRWPAELEAEMELSDGAREWVSRCDELLPYADGDGIVCLSPTRGEESAAQRLRRLLSAAFGQDWSPEQERRLIEAASSNGKVVASLEDWLYDRFFEEHCRLFHHRPFVWHIWDGRRDGFHALVNYHRLAGPHDEGRRTLETLTYTYLGDWIERQTVEQLEGKEGADGRLAAALDLQEQLIKILEGEPPYDIFVRWKPLHQQPIGWEPDLNDGVRVNIRPFLLARLRTSGRASSGILRSRPNIKWGKDRGKEPESLWPKADYPWFWGCDPERNPEHRKNFMGGSQYTGLRWNDLHYSNEVKLAARRRAAEEVKS